MRKLKRNLWRDVKCFFQGGKPFPSNVIMTAPHGSWRVPISVFPHLCTHYQTGTRLLLNFSDYGTRALLESVPENHKIIARYGRIIGDPNRKRNDEDIIRLKDFGGVHIFRKKFEDRLTKSWLRAFWLKKLLIKSYEPFYRDVFHTIDKLARHPLNETKPLILLDVHDTGNRMLGRNWREDKNRKRKRIPPVVISNAPDEEINEEIKGTAPKWWLEDFREKLADKLGLEEKEIEINTVFKGGNVIRYFGNPNNNRKLKKILGDKHIYAVQIEFNRDLYLDEVTQRTIPWKIRYVRNALMETVQEISEELE
jgi:hypothetical protein